MYPGMLIIHRSTSQDVIVSLFIFLNFHQKQNFVTYLTPYVFKKIWMKVTINAIILQSLWDYKKIHNGN